MFKFCVLICGILSVFAIDQDLTQEPIQQKTRKSKTLYDETVTCFLQNQELSKKLLSIVSYVGLSGLNKDVLLSLAKINSTEACSYLNEDEAQLILLAQQLGLTSTIIDTFKHTAILSK